MSSSAGLLTPRGPFSGAAPLALRPLSAIAATAAEACRSAHQAPAVRSVAVADVLACAGRDLWRHLAGHRRHGRGARAHLLPELVVARSRRNSLPPAPGFAPIELYADTAQWPRGPWTDVYGLCAVMHSLVTGLRPPPAPERRVDDPYEPLAQLGLSSTARSSCASSTRACPCSLPSGRSRWRIWRAGWAWWSTQMPCPRPRRGRRLAGLAAGWRRASAPAGCEARQAGMDRPVAGAGHRGWHLWLVPVRPRAQCADHQLRADAAEPAHGPTGGAGAAVRAASRAASGARRAAGLQPAQQAVPVLVAEFKPAAVADAAPPSTEALIGAARSLDNNAFQAEPAVPAQPQEEPSPAHRDARDGAAGHQALGRGLGQRRRAWHQSAGEGAAPDSRQISGGAAQRGSAAIPRHAGNQGGQARGDFTRLRIARGRVAIGRRAPAPSAAAG